MHKRGKGIFRRVNRPVLLSACISRPQGRSPAHPGLSEQTWGQVRVSVLDRVGGRWAGPLGKCRLAICKVMRRCLVHKSWLGIIKCKSAGLEDLQRVLLQGGKQSAPCCKRQNLGREKWRNIWLVAGCWGEERKALSKKLHQSLAAVQERVGACTEALLEAAVPDSQEGWGWYLLR